MFLTVVLNLETGVVVFVGAGKGADALEPFWEPTQERQKEDEAVAMWWNVRRFTPHRLFSVRDTASERPPHDLKIYQGSPFQIVPTGRQELRTSS